VYGVGAKAIKEYQHARKKPWLQLQRLSNSLIDLGLTNKLRCDVEKPSQQSK